MKTHKVKILFLSLVLLFVSLCVLSFGLCGGFLLELLIWVFEFVIIHIL